MTAPLAPERAAREDEFVLDVRSVAIGGRDIATRLVNRCAFPADLGRFDLVLASDVLYEQRNAPLVARAVVGSLAPDGVALGARVGEHRAAGHGDGTAKQTITIHEVRLG